MTDPHQPEAGHDVVVIGGSAGSLPVLKTVLGALPADFPAAVLIVTHLPTGVPSTIPDLLDRLCPLPVVRAAEGEPVAAGRVYVAPADAHLLVIEGRIRLGQGPRENLSRPAIDPLFRSAAVCFGPRVVGVVLSGMLDDGAAGLASIRRCGGIAIVQDPVDADYDDMPRNAIAATSVDEIAIAADIAAVLQRAVRQPAGAVRDVPRDLALEVDIALGGRSDFARMIEIADTVPMTCPTCAGVLSEIREGPPLRYRCQTGHGFSAKMLEQRQQSAVDEALRVALRIIDERTALVTRMGIDAAQTGRLGSAEMYAQRAAEYRGYAEVIRKAVLEIAPERSQ